MSDSKSNQDLPFGLEVLKAFATASAVSAGTVAGFFGLLFVVGVISDKIENQTLKSKNKK